MPPKILVLIKEGDLGKCAYCGDKTDGERTSFVVHHMYADYEPTEAEKEAKKRPFDKTCMEKFVCTQHFNEHFSREPARYLELGGQADFTFTSVEAWRNRTKKNRVFFYDKEK